MDRGCAEDTQNVLGAEVGVARKARAVVVAAWRNMVARREVLRVVDLGKGPAGLGGPAVSWVAEVLKSPV